MRKYLRVTMPDGSRWDVPADIIAHSRASYYANKDTGETSGEKHTELYKEEMQYTLENDDEIVDWASNNMNWDDVKKQARMVKGGKCDYQEGWNNGDKEVVELKS